MLYWVAVTLAPTKKESEDEGKMEELVLQPKIVVAKSDKAAAIKVMMDSPELKEYDLDRLEVVVRPF